MCAIAGLMVRSGASPDGGALAKMGDSMAHRGPDDQGDHQEGNVALTHRRLSIIDLEGGRQPLFLKWRGARLALVANGEIYNYRELRDALDGADFATDSDCEPPLRLYARHGLEFVHHLRGMYGLALHDPVNKRLILSRDPFGIKPLYYVQTDHMFAFASEVRAFAAAGILTPSINKAAATKLLQLQYASGPQTVLKEVRRLLPGETIVVEDAQIVHRERRQALPDTNEESAFGDETALDQLDRVLEDSVRMHRRADVPIALFLSGGIDSSAILAMTARQEAAPVRAYTVGFPDMPVADERAHAAKVAKAVGADHTEISLSEKDFWSLLPRVVEAVDDPIADYAIVPTFHLAERVKADGLKVVLSGEGGDELFAGYGRYRVASRYWPFRRAMHRKGIMDGLDVMRSTSGWRDGIASVEREASKWSGLRALQAVDCNAWLPDDLMIKLDRCLMAHGVEGRVPFLDPKVADFAFRLKDKQKTRKGMGKWLLRRWLDSVLPEAAPFAAKKGFSVPVGPWISARPDIGALVAAQPGVVELCEPDRVAGLFHGSADSGRAAKAAWTLLFYALWHHHHICGRPLGEDVAESLARG